MILIERNSFRGRERQIEREKERGRERERGRQRETERQRQRQRERQREIIAFGRAFIINSRLLALIILVFIRAWVFRTLMKISSNEE